MSISDQSLLRSIGLNKDDTAFKMLYDRYANQLLAYIFARLQSFEESEDIVHDIFIELWDSAPNIIEKTDGDIRKWLFSRANTISSGTLKKRRRMVRIDDLSTTEDSELSVCNVLEESNYNELTELIDHVVKNLPIHLQKIYQLRIHFHYSVEESSKILSLSPNTIYTKTSEIMSELRRQIKEEDQSIKYKPRGRKSSKKNF